MGEVFARQVQYGKENPASRGTAVAATAMWPGTIKVPADRTRTYLKTTTGRRVQSIGGVFTNYLARPTLASDGYFEILPFLLSMALKGNVTASETTPGQADYKWDFGPSLTADNAQDSFTVEYGDDTEQYEMEYCMVESLKISGRPNELVQLEASLYGRQITVTNLTAGLTARTLQPMLANMTKFYVDTTWAGLGGTQVANLLKSWTLDITTGLHPKFMADGQRYFSTHGAGYMEAVLTMVYEGNAAADGQFDLFQAGTPRAIRLLCEGPQIGSGANNSLKIDLYGEYETIVPLDSEEDGNSLHAAVFRMTDDNQATPHAIDVEVVCDSNAV